jgi:hypothetical protein
MQVSQRWPDRSSRQRGEEDRSRELNDYGVVVDIHLHILPAPRQPRLPRLYIGTIPGNGRIDRYYTG